jgi:hypothetical protein
MNKTMNEQAVMVSNFFFSRDTIMENRQSGYELSAPLRIYGAGRESNTALLLYNKSWRFSPNDAIAPPQHPRLRESSGRNRPTPFASSQVRART